MTLPTVTKPSPVTVVVSVSAAFWKFALTDWLAPVGTKVQVVVVETHAPEKPVKLEPRPAAAVSFTAMLSKIGLLQFAPVPQLIPPEEEVTRPEPLPVLTTLTTVRPRYLASGWPGPPGT